MTPANGAPLPRPSHSPIVLEPGRGPVLPLQGTISADDSLVDAVELLQLQAFTDGREPYARAASLEQVLPRATLRPAAEGRLIRESVYDQIRALLVVGDGWTLSAVHYTANRSARVTVTATGPETAARILEAAVRDAVEDVAPAPDLVPIGFWHHPGRPVRMPRDITAPSWEEIRAHYAPRVADALDAVVATREPAGRILLLHGPPGTGKTTLLRALAREWRDWCQVDCVLDPEVLFSQPSYLLQVTLEQTGDDGPPWRMLLLEDCDELIRGEAKANTGQALSRLLNLTDGMLGQGRRILIGVTTNEDISALHPAVTRPGRSMAHVEVGRFPREEARAWLGEGHPGAAAIGPDGATLAELFALREGVAPVSVEREEEAPATGLYL